MLSKERVDIDRLTVDAERGRGCLVKAALDCIHALDERIEILSRIAEMNSMHRRTNPNVPFLVVEGTARQYSEAVIGLVRVSQGAISWRQNLYQERISLCPVA